MTLSIQTDRALTRAAASTTRYVLARITAPSAPARATRIPVNVGIVLDRSGSMNDDRKFGLARVAVAQALRMLRPEDRFVLVVYDTEVDVLMASTQATPEAKRHALDALQEIGPRGGTDLGAGWLRGCEQIAEFLDDEQVSRCLLLTDGLANQGITDRDELARHAGELRQRGVSTTTFGVGADFDERMLRDIAHEGGGNFYFIQDAAQIPDMLASELGEALQVTLRNVSLTVTPPIGATTETLNHFRHRQLADRCELHIDLGDLVSAQELEVVVGVTLPTGDVGAQVFATFALTCSGELVEGTECRQSWTHATHHDNDLQPRNAEVDRAVAKLQAARARAEATEANREGRYDDARLMLQEAAVHIRRVADGDLELESVARALGESVAHFADAPMSAAMLKASFYESDLIAKSRAPSGRANRGA